VTCSGSISSVGGRRRGGSSFWPPFPVLDDAGHRSPLSGLPALVARIRRRKSPGEDQGEARTARDVGRGAAATPGDGSREGSVPRGSSRGGPFRGVRAPRTAGKAFVCRARPARAAQGRRGGGRRGDAAGERTGAADQARGARHRRPDHRDSNRPWSDVRVRPRGDKANRVSAMADDLALAMRCESVARGPNIPGKGVMDSRSRTHAGHRSSFGSCSGVPPTHPRPALSLAMGRTSSAIRWSGTSGRCPTPDRRRHRVGKSVALHTMILSILFRATPR